MLKEYCKPSGSILSSHVSEKKTETQRGKVTSFTTLIKH